MIRYFISIYLFRKGFIFQNVERNKYSVFLFLVFLLFFSFFSSFTYLDMCADRDCRSGTWPNTFDQLQFAASLLQIQHFHSISRFVLSDCYEIHRTKCACAPNAPTIRATDTFIYSATNTNRDFTKSTFI